MFIFGRKSARFPICYGIISGGKFQGSQLWFSHIQQKKINLNHSQKKFQLALYEW